MVVVSWRWRDERLALGGGEGTLGHRELEVAGELAAEFTVGPSQSERELRGVVEAEPRGAGNVLEGAQVRGGEHEVRAGRPSPAPAYRRAGDCRQRQDDFAHGIDLPVGSNLPADAVRLASDAPLDVNAVAVEAQEAVNRLLRGRDLTLADLVVRPVQHEGERGRVRHGINLYCHPERQRGIFVCVPSWPATSHGTWIPRCRSDDNDASLIMTPKLLAFLL